MMKYKIKYPNSNISNFVYEELIYDWNENNFNAIKMIDHNGQIINEFFNYNYNDIHGNCIGCNKNDLELEQLFLICDTKNCKFGGHICCLDPPLSEIPDGNWYCPQCQGTHIIKSPCPQCHSRIYRKNELIKCKKCQIVCIHSLCASKEFKKQNVIDINMFNWLCKWCKKKEKCNKRKQNKTRKRRKDFIVIDCESDDNEPLMKKRKLNDKINTQIALNLSMSIPLPVFDASKMKKRKLRCFSHLLKEKNDFKIDDHFFINNCNKRNKNKIGKRKKDVIVIDGESDDNEPLMKKRKLNDDTHIALNLSIPLPVFDISKMKKRKLKCFSDFKMGKNKSRKRPRDVIVID